MWLFGHVGLTIGTSLAISAVSKRGRHLIQENVQSEMEGANTAMAPTLWLSPGKTSSWGFSDWLKSEGRIDYRLVAIGSVLPDLDKFISLGFLGNFGRGPFHTLLAGLILSTIGIYVFRKLGETRILQLAFCWMLHMTLDQMWLNPKLFLWPLYGLVPSTGKMNVSQFTDYMVDSLTTDPSQYIPELIGLAIVVWFLANLVVRGKLWAFIKMGSFS